MRVLDIGGTLNSWRLAPTRPKQLVLLNLSFESYHSTFALLARLT
jgi:hypothetical protein